MKNLELGTSCLKLPSSYVEVSDNEMEYTDGAIFRRIMGAVGIVLGAKKVLVSVGMIVVTKDLGLPLGKAGVVSGVGLITGGVATIIFGSIGVAGLI